jgi:hypothetical protein
MALNDWIVKRAGNPDVEREHLNKILQEIKAALAELETAVGNSDSSTGGVGNTPDDHGALSGLADDDHTRYHTDDRAFLWLEDNFVEGSGVDAVFSDPTITLYILTITGTATEALTAGRFVNLDASGEVQHADSSTNSKMANGFVLSSYSDGATNVRVYYGGENTGLSGLTIGDTYYLSTSGQVVNSPPEGDSPIIVQQLGIAKSATSLLVNIQQAIERPDV